MRTWDEIGTLQPIVSKMIHNAILKNRVAHAYLFEGGRGTGKKATAFLFAQTLFCKNRNGYHPCQHCTDCKRIQSYNHPDVHYLEPDGQSLKKEQILNLQKEFAKTGMESNKKVYIINHADKMTDFAANSLLKFLEEPESQSVALLLTEQVHQIIPTIISRCQVLSFKPLTTETLIQNLLEKGFQKHIVNTAAILTNDLQEAIAIIEDDWFAQARNIVIQLVEALHERPDQLLFTIQDQWLSIFNEKQQHDIGLNLLLIYFKDLIYIKIGEENKIVYTDQIDRLQKYNLYSSEQVILSQITAILEAKKRLNANVNVHLLMDQLALKLQEG